MEPIPRRNLFEGSWDDDEDSAIIQECGIEEEDLNEDEKQKEIAAYEELRDLFQKRYSKKETKRNRFDGKKFKAEIS